MLFCCEVLYCEFEATLYGIQGQELVQQTPARILNLLGHTAILLASEDPPKECHHVIDLRSEKVPTYRPLSFAPRPLPSMLTKAE